MRRTQFKQATRKNENLKTLQDLDGEIWGEAPFPSHVVKECHRLHKTPLCEFHVEDLRLMIGQQIGILYLLPLALEQLRISPLAEGAFFPGDLLLNVLRIDRAFWKQHPSWLKEVRGILEQLADIPNELTEAVGIFMHESKLGPVGESG